MINVEAHAAHYQMAHAITLRLNDRVATLPSSNVSFGIILSKGY